MSGDQASGRPPTSARAPQPRMAPASAQERSADEVLAEEVKVLLARRRLPDRALAPVLGKTQQSVSDKLAGRSRWTVEDLARVARYFGVGAGVLLPHLEVLPHVDSNHEPAGGASVLVTAGAPAPAGGAGGSPSVLGDLIGAVSARLHRPAPAHAPTHAPTHAA